MAFAPSTTVGVSQQGIPTSGGGGPGGGGVAGDLSEVLADAARRIQDDTSWYETLDLMWEEAEDSGGDVETIVAFNVANGALDSASESMLARVFGVLKRLLDDVQDAARACEEVVELIQYCVGISRCLVKAAASVDMPRETVMTCGEFKSEMDDVGRFVQTYGTQTGCCGRMTLNSRDRAAVAKHKRKLEDLLDAVLAGLAARPSLDVKAQPSEPCHGLTFVSHAGEDKRFVRSLLRAIEQANVPALSNDDMALGASSEDDRTSQAAEADLAIVVLSRPFLTKGWPMKELNTFIESKKNITIYPLYYKVTPDELWDIAATYDRQAGDQMKGDPEAWRALMHEIGGPTRDPASTSLPNPRVWRKDVHKLGPLTGLRRQEFANDEQYVEIITRIVSPPRLPDIMPPLPAHFVEPPLVDDVISALLGTSTGPKTRGVVLTGIGGAGKSLIASAAARDKMLRRRFSDGVLWLNDEPGDFSEQRLLFQLNTLATQFRKLVLSRRFRQGQDFQYADDDFKDLWHAQGYFPMWQKKYRLRCLLVVDNVWNLQVLEAAGAMGFHILATARKKDVMPASPGWRSIPVPQLDEEASCLVLTKCSGAVGPVPREPALQVAKDCAYLPLALAIAGSMRVVVDAPSTADAWRKLHESLKNKAEMLEYSGGQQLSLNATLVVSFDELGREERSRFLKLAVLGNGVLAPKAMVCHLWEQDLADARVAAKDLVNRSLVQVHGDEYLVHDLLLAFAKRKIGEFQAIKETAISRQAEYLGQLAVVRAYSDEIEVNAGVYSLIALWRSLEDLSVDAQLEVNTYKTSLARLEGSEATADLVVTYNTVARLFTLQGKLDDADPLFQRALTIDEKAYGPDHPEVATDLNNRAKLLMLQETYDEAILLLDRALAIRREELGENHELTVYTMQFLQDARETQVAPKG